MDSLERLMSAAKPLPPALTSAGSSLPRRALVHASLATAASIGRRGRHLTGTFCLTGDTMEGIIQCLVFLKAFSVSETDFSSTSTPNIYANLKIRLSISLLF